MHETDVVVVGGGVAGLTAGMFTARNGLETVVYDAGGSILQRNAHLENVPGFPAGINARQYLELLTDQARRAGCTIHEAMVSALERTEAGFAGVLEEGNQWRADRVIAASKNEVGYLADLESLEIREYGKPFVVTDDRGRTGVDGLYAAGRLAGVPHQAVVAAGHGATVAVTLLEDHEAGFYHDWVAPEGYFTERGRPVPPGVEEIDETERRRRERASVEYLSGALQPGQEEPETHPSLE